MTRSNPFAADADFATLARRRGEIAEHRSLAAAARQRARYDVDVEHLEAAAYHDAEAERLEAELDAAGRGVRGRGVRGRRRRANPLVAPSTLAFRRWFAGSWAVDDKGQPIVVYRGEHGEDTSELVRSRMGSGVLSFTDRPDLASHFALRRYQEGETPTPRVIPVFLRIKNPVITPDDVNEKKHYTVSTKLMVKRVGREAVDRVFEEHKDLIAALDEPNPRLTPFMYLNNKHFVRAAKEAGFDGALFQSDYALFERGKRTEFGLCMEYRPFSVEQVWPALGAAPLTEGRANPAADPGDWVTIEDAAFDAHDEVDDWVTIEECGCHSCVPMRLNPPKRKATGAYADLDSIVPVIAEALAKHGLTMQNVAEVKFTRGGKSRAGTCSYSPSTRQCKIAFNGLAWPAFTEESRLNTVLHEAAHAIQFLTTGRSDHGPAWQRIARSIGCTGDKCMSVEASQAMVDAYSEAKGLPKRKVITRESAMEASADFAVGDYVSFDHKRERWAGKIVSKGPMHATVMIQSPRQGITGKIPYPSLQKEAPPRHAEKVAGVDKPAPGESLSAWQARTGRPDFLSLQRVERSADRPAPGESVAEWQARTGRGVRQ